MTPRARRSIAGPRPSRDAPRPAHGVVRDLPPGITLQRACGTGLDTVVLVANKIALGQIDSGIAAGRKAL